MRNYIYPAVFVKDEDENIYHVFFPDLEITTEGAMVEEAYLYAREFLKSYFKYVEKYDLDFNMPTDFEVIRKSVKNDDIVLLIDATTSKKE